MAQVDVSVKKALRPLCTPEVLKFLEGELKKIYPHPVTAILTGLDLAQPAVSVDLVDFGGIQPKEIEGIMKLVYAVMKQGLKLNEEKIFVNLMNTTVRMEF